MINVQHPDGYPDNRCVTLLESDGWFLATELIPYGNVGPRVIKFTGVEGDGASPEDATDRDQLAEDLLQAFAHFVYVSSNKTKLLVDLQGGLDGLRWDLNLTSGSFQGRGLLMVVTSSC